MTTEFITKVTCNRCGAVSDTIPTGSYLPVNWAGVSDPHRALLADLCDVCVTGLCEYLAGGKVVPKPFLDRITARKPEIVLASPTTIEPTEDVNGRVG